MGRLKQSALKLAVAISGRGSNLQSLIDACSSPDFPAKIALVLSDKADAYGLERARKAGLKTRVIDYPKGVSRAENDRKMTLAIEEAGADFVCLAGFMRLLSDDFCTHWHDRMINIHPSLLPDYKGLNVHERVIEAGEKFSGCTVHYVRTEMDTGPIIKQARVEVLPGDSPEDLAARVLEQEHLIYPAALRLVVEGKT